MATYYLDKTGLSYFWSKIKAAISGKQDTLTAGKGISLDSNTVANRGDSVFYGTCATAAGTAAKVVVCSAFTSADLVAGTRITVKFDNNNSFNGQATLNINGTGAKNIYYTASTTNARYMWIAGESVDFVYNGAQWATVNGGLATTTYYGVTKLTTNAVSTSEVLALTPKTLNSYSQNMVSGAPAYSSSATYAVGDRVRYSYQTWECNTAITTAESWNAEHWTALDPLQTQIDALESSQFSGDYNDLTNKPTIPAAQVNSDWNASSGVAQILNKPTIPSTYWGATASNGAVDGTLTVNGIGQVWTQTGAGDNYILIGTPAGNDFSSGYLQIGYNTRETTGTPKIVANTDLYMSSKQIHGLAAGTYNTDAVNKQQLDNAIAGISITAITDTEINNIMGVA